MPLVYSPKILFKLTVPGFNKMESGFIINVIDAENIIDLHEDCFEEMP